MAILDLQRRTRELGRIRTGRKAASNGAPQKLDKFRLTSPSENLIRKVAELYGGEAQQWTPAGGVAQWEVFTDAKRLPIMVPPQPVSQWYETWSAGGCTHRCDGVTDYITGEACDNDSKLHEASKPTTRLKVVLRDVEGLGVWRLESHGWNAAVELPDAAEFLAQAGGYVEGWVALEARTTKTIKDGQAQTRHFMVPVLEIEITPAELMAGKGRVAAPALAGGPATDRPALMAASPDYAALADTLTTREQVAALWRQARDAGHLTDTLKDHLTRVGNSLPTPEVSGGTPSGDEAGPEPVSSPPPRQDAEGIADAVVVEDVEMVWQLLVGAAGRAGLSLPDLQDHFAANMAGVDTSSATAEELRYYLDHVLPTVTQGGE